MSARVGIGRVATALRGLGWFTAALAVIGMAVLEIHDNGRFRISAEVWLAVGVACLSLAITYALAWIIDGFAADK